MVRPPVPPVYFFVIDVSVYAIKSGMLEQTCAVIKHLIQQGKLPERAELGFITFDHQIHIFNLKPGMSSPKMIVLADIDDG